MYSLAIIYRLKLHMISIKIVGIQTSETRKIPFELAEMLSLKM